MSGGAEVVEAFDGVEVEGTLYRLVWGVAELQRCSRLLRWAGIDSESILKSWTGMAGKWRSGMTSELKPDTWHMGREDLAMGK